jgi:uncharacterized repeat protein (TIGR01451 family)
MKRFRLLLGLLWVTLLLGSAYSAQAQRFDWMQPLRNAALESRSVTDATGNTYVTGTYYDSLVTTSITLHVPANMRQCCYLAKINASGSIEWAQNLYADSLNITAASIGLDDHGGLYVSGYHGNGAHFGTIQKPTTASYIAKFDTAGTVIWVKDLRIKVRNPQGGIEIGMVVERSGSFYIHGRASWVDSLETFRLDRRGSVVSFVAKCSPTGMMEWVQQIINPLCNPNNPNTWIWTMAVDNQGNCFAVGQHNDVTTYGTAPNAPTSIGCANYVAKYSSTGNFEWMQDTYGPSFLCVTTDPAGACYVGGINTSTLGMTLGTLSTTSPGAFVLKIDAAGNPRWLQQETEDPNAQMRRLTIDRASGDLLATGWYHETCRFGGYPVLATGGNNTFLARFSSAGQTRWVISPEGRPQTGVYPTDITTDDAGNAYLFGTLREGRWAHEPVSFGPLTFANIGSEGSFMVKLNQRVNTLTGLVYVDSNTNGRHDPGEQPFPLAVSLEENQQHQLTTANALTGQFQAYADQGAYDLHLAQVPANYYLTQGSAGYQGSFTGYSQTDSARHFGLAPVLSRQDIRVTLTPYTPARRGIPTIYRAHVENVGTTAIAAGQVSVAIDRTATIIGTSPVAAPGPAGAIRNWNFTNLLPFSALDFDITLNIPLNVALGAPLTSLVSASATTGTDFTPFNNADTLQQVVRGSIDPNDISVNHTVLTAAQIAAEEPLDYIVRFENIGTDTAFVVVIQDSLPAGLLQLATIEVISQSHNVRWNLSGPGLLTMRFPGIRLPQQSIDAIRSHGFVRFRITPRVTLVPGTRIPNTAHITFDYNAPLRTNEVATLVQNPNGLVAEATATALSLYPNPATDRTLLTADLPTAGTVQVRLLDALGREVRRTSVTAPAGVWQHRLGTNGLMSGVYVVRLTLPDGAAVSRRLVVQE